MIYIKNNTNLTNYLTLKRQKLKRRKNLRKLFIYLLICCVPILTFIFKILLCCIVGIPIHMVILGENPINVLKKIRR